MKNYLFILTITPIHNFIAQARTTKDFYVGSQIISDLIKELIKKFDKEDIIFPYPKSNSLSNKIIAKIYVEEFEQLTKELKQIVDHFIETKLFSINLNSKELNTKQLKDVFKLFYTAVKINNYKDSYLEAEKNIANIKNLRPFIQVESKNICYVCAEREAFYRDNKNRDRCGVCYLKEKYNNKSYLSTAGIATLDWVNSEYINKENYKIYKSKFKNFDEELLYEENLNKQYLESNYKIFSKTDIKELKELLNNISNIKPSKQYALINFDGDNIGKILSMGLNGIELEQFHNEFSKKLSDFSQEINNIFNDKIGRVIYSGGDDFLGFLNLIYLDEVINRIKDKFDEIVNVYDTKISYSTSIIISHYKAPLHKIILFSRRLLEETKQRYSSKDNLIKGGIGLEIYSSSSNLAKFIGTYKDFNNLKVFKNRKVNLYQLEKLFSFAKENENFDEYLNVLEMLKVDLRRFFSKKDIEFSKTDIAIIEELLVSQVKDNNIDLDNFFGFFKIIEQLSKDSNE